MQPNLPTFRSDSAPVGFGFVRTQHASPPPSALGGPTEGAPGAARNLRRLGGVRGFGPQPPQSAETGVLGAPHSHPTDPYQGPSGRKLIFVCVLCEYYFAAKVTVSSGHPDLMPVEILRGLRGPGRGFCGDFSPPLSKPTALRPSRLEAWSCSS